MIQVILALHVLDEKQMKISSDSSSDNDYITLIETLSLCLLTLKQARK